MDDYPHGDEHRWFLEPEPLHTPSITVTSPTKEQTRKRNRLVKRGARVVPFGFSRALLEEPEPSATLTNMSTITIKRGQTFRKRRTGVIREVTGFTTRPSNTEPSDGIRRARLVNPETGTETRIRVDQFFKSYQSV